MAKKSLVINEYALEQFKLIKLDNYVYPMIVKNLIILLILNLMV